MRHTVSVLQTGVVDLSIEHDKLEGDKLSVQLLVVLLIGADGQLPEGTVDRVKRVNEWLGKISVRGSFC